MASKNIQYKITGVPTIEEVRKFNEDPYVFFRFQNPYERLTKRSCSWGMMFQSKAEAIRDCEEWGMTPDEAVLNGKSCMDTLEGLHKWICEFDNDYVLLVFEGNDTGTTGHDGEYVATYHKKVAVWSYTDALNMIYKLREEDED
ncbi:hypothetical protein G8S21_04725 [Clostridium botulinum C]|uniref:hypothetical protein n=1 Tax=Clostridium botulinum TaxID=1491 RepID=UPI001E310B45|nr:hypothetical protein [Clostridium botulinum]MCD3245253.1 hypothetical protein [Clostridium botulinum C]MCD3261632.1 hypothetical protein [Clostridium botulinum C]